MSVGLFAFVVFIVVFAVGYNLLHDHEMKKMREENERTDDE